MPDIIVNILVILFLAVLFLPGIYFTWELRHDGKFDITEVDGKFQLWYCHRVEWMLDGTHDTRELAIEAINGYALRKAGQNIRYRIK